MHELLLFGQLPVGRHGQLLKVLAGLTAMQPQRVIERHVLFKPSRGPVQAVVQKGGSQGVQNPQRQAQQGQQNKELYHTHLVKAVEEDDFGRGNDEDQPMDVDNHVTDHEDDKQVWQWQFQDVPEPGKRATIFRMVETIDILQGDAQAYMDGLGYRYISEYVVEGHRFVVNNTVLFLHRVLQWPSPPSTASINTPLLPFSELKPLDSSGAYVLEAKIRLSGSNPSLIKLGEDELIGFRNRMKGVIDMKLPERLALDTRVK